jgi:hypothetical protein
MQYVLSHPVCYTAHLPGIKLSSFASGLPFLEGTSAGKNGESPLKLALSSQIKNINTKAKDMSCVAKCWKGKISRTAVYCSRGISESY